MDERLRRITAELARVPRLPGRAKSFGEERHGFRLGPPLTEDRVSAFEAQHGVRLPAAYRRFLTEVGHDGAGPHYGLLPLRAWNQGGLSESGDLARPFPLRPTTLRVGRGWWERLGSPRPPFAGTMAITSQGCGYLTVLVVTGPARGRILNIDLDPRRESFFSPDTDFLAWYERWLDETADGLDTHGFELSLPGTEPTLADTLADSPDPDLRAAAARTLRRRPHLAPATRAVLRAAATADPEPGVRATAIRALNVALPDEELPVLQRALTDSAAAVRETAVRALAGRGTSWHARARRLLRDEDPDVRKAALKALEESQVLTEGDVLPLRDDTAPSVRAAAISHLSRLDAPSAPAVARAALADPDPVPRHAAVAIGIRRRWLTEPDLRRVEHDPDDLIRRQVASALRRMAARSAGPTSPRAGREGGPMLAP
ncbi:HEAT repeat domain-containing protein [Kitasatospora sp. NPDC059408]|uniref:HEAT repeat domain-containing protein n=1 Tax=Kitasatospora sp. NPDC059408 TaxID=3346823 RepID=UPI0036CFB2E5